MSTFTIATFCSVLWYICVLLTWVWLGRGMHLFSNHSLHGWLLVLLALLGSALANFFCNPLMWVIAGCYITAAKKESKTSKWQFYPSLIGISSAGAAFRAAAAMGKVCINVRRSMLQCTTTIPSGLDSSRPLP